MANQLPNRYSVAPLGGLDVGAKMTNIVEGGRKQNRLIKWNKTAPGIIQGGNPREIADLMAKYPEMQQQIASASGYEDAALLKESVDLSKEILTGTTDPKQALAMHIQQGQARGEDVTKYINVLGQELNSPGYAKQWAEKWTALNDPTGFQSYQKTLPQSAQKQPLSTPTDIDDYVASANEQAIIDTGKPLSPGKQNEARLQFKRAQATESRANRIASLDAEMELKGKVEAGVISQVEAAKISIKAFDRLEKINKNISNLDEGIKLLKGGANTGAVDKYLPSIKANSIKLDNLAGRLGLDIISAVTFGALSESELKFAIDTALPQGLQPNELMQWMIEKKVTQGKLSDYLESSAIYLGTPGNTVSGWIKKGKEKEKVTGLPTGVTEEDITLTMQNNNMTREEVLTRLKGGQ